MANLVKERRFIKSDVAKNNNKFWYIELHDDCTVVTKNGRVGDSAQVHPKSFGSMSAAETFLMVRSVKRQGIAKVILN